MLQLTPALLDQVTPQPREFSLADPQCLGLRLRVQPSGAKSWITQSVIATIAAGLAAIWIIGALI